MMGVEAAVIGNHDHLLGGSVLGDQLRRANVKTKFISANINRTPSMNLGNLLTPYVDVDKGGIPIRIIGLSTPAIHFQYAIYPGRILPVIPVAEAHARLARWAGKELVVALTHIGKDDDENLAHFSTQIDIIIGGHSHTRLEQVDWVKNLKGKNVPIVQAWAHGLVVGSLLLDVKGPGQVSVVSYKLHEIESPLAEDPGMVEFVKRAADDRNQYFKGRWDEIIGETLVPMSGYVDGNTVQKESCWGKHMAKMSMQVANADMGMHLAAFEGVYKPAGEISYGDMVDNFPHFRKYGDEGWEIATIRARGAILKPILRGAWFLRNKLGVNFYGLSYRVVKGAPVDFKLMGRPLDDKVFYTMAFPAEIGLALKTSLPLVTRRIFPSLRASGKFFWPSMEQYIRENTPISCQ